MYFDTSLKEDTEDTTMLVQIEEAKCDIRKLSYVTKLSPVREVNGMGPGCQVSLSCSRFQEYGSCPKKQEPAVRLSCVNPTEVACLQELLKRLQDHAGQGTHIHRTDHFANSSGSALASHLFQQGLEHGAQCQCRRLTHIP